MHSRAPAEALTALLLLATVHWVVDTFACLVQPLWPALGREFAGDQSTELWLYVVWTLSGSLSQLLFGYLGDRYHWRWLIWCGPIVSIVCMSAIGLAGSAASAGVLLLVGGLGTAAFHPESATAAGECLPTNRSRAMSIFYIGGYLGQAAGPYYGGWMADHFALPGVAWGIPGGLLLLALCGLALRTWRLPQAPSPMRPTPLREILDGKYVALSLVLVIGMLRVLVAMGVPLALAYFLEGQGATKSQTGLAQSMLLAGIGAGAVLCAMLVRHHHERLALWLPPLGVAPLIACLPRLAGGSMLAAMFAAGVLLGIAIPVLASYGQQLLPRGQRIASSWTMGVSWGVGGSLGAAMVRMCGGVNSIEYCFSICAAAAVVSSLLCFALPRLNLHGGRRD